MNPYASLCDDFYVNMNLSTEMELPANRETRPLRGVGAILTKLAPALRLREEILLTQRKLAPAMETAKRMIAVEESRPQVHFPSHRPAGGFVTSCDQRRFCGSK